jgi:hypothetical protein
MPRDAIALRGRRQGATALPAPTAMGFAPSNPNSCLRLEPVRLRGARPGWAATPAPPARDFVPWIPDLIQSRYRSQARMPTGTPQPAAGDQYLSRIRGCLQLIRIAIADWLSAQQRHVPPRRILVVPLLPEGAWGNRLRFPQSGRGGEAPCKNQIAQWGARGAQPPRINACMHSCGEREGQSPLASILVARLRIGAQDLDRAPPDQSIIQPVSNGSAECNERFLRRWRPDA